MLVLIVVLLFGFVVLFGAPYLPTLKSQKSDALDLLDLKPGQTLVELGSGDGRMLTAAARRGVYSIGYELNPLLVLYSKLATYKYRHFITIKLANFWSTPLPQCEGIYVFLLERYMPKLHTKITQEISSSVNPVVDLSHSSKTGMRLSKKQTERVHYGVKVVSFAFSIPDVKPVTEKNGLYLYEFTTKKKSRKQAV